MEALDLAEARDEVPDLDDSLVQPESRAEIVRGRLVMSPPADAPHASQHSRIDYVLSAHAEPPYIVAADMLTRTSRESDFAPDVSVFRFDPYTGKKLIAELAFEVVSSQSLSVATDKARELTQRGTRRVFCLHIVRGRVLEWSASEDDWRPLAPESVITRRWPR